MDSYVCLYMYLNLKEYEQSVKSYTALKVCFKVMQCYACYLLLYSAIVAVDMEKNILQDMIKALGCAVRINRGHSQVWHGRH